MIITEGLNTGNRRTSWNWAGPLSAKIYQHIDKAGIYMENERFCDCGSVADWEEIGSTWICMACRNKDVKKKADEFKEVLEKLELVEGALQILKIDTTSIKKLLGKLKDEINKIEVSVEEI